MTQLIANPVAVARQTRGELLKTKWQTISPPSHEFLAVICPEEEGGFSVFAPRYPGIVSQGETHDEAKANIGEAFTGMLEACRKRGASLQYCNQPAIELKPGCVQVWITVDG